MPMLIGITGKALSGKDTVGDILFMHFDFINMPFARPLKLAAAAAFGDLLENYHIQARKAEVNPYWEVTRRQQLQDFGEAMCVQFGEDFWIRRWFLDYIRLRDTDNIVVTDVRKDIEADYIRSLGGRIIHLYRSGAGLSGHEANHKTEQGILAKAGDLTLVNDSTLGDLERQVLHLIAEIQA